MKRKLLAVLSLLLVATTVLISNNYQSTKKDQVKIERIKIAPTQKGKKKTLEERALYNEARDLYEFYRQVNPNTGIISKTEKQLEFKQAKASKIKNNLTSKTPQSSYIDRGPSNFGGRTRSIVVDISDPTGNTILAGGVSGGVFRTTNAGANWTKVSSNDEIHNVTAIVQDPRVGFQNIWYYATGEGLGNSAGNGSSFYFGQGIWQSNDSGLTWSQIPSTNSNQVSFDSTFDIIFNLAVHPLTGNLFAATAARIMRYNGVLWDEEINGGQLTTAQATDVVITSTGRVYAAFSGNHSAAIEGVYTSANGNSGWSRINIGSFVPSGRVVLALAPSNEDLLYILFDNGLTGDCANDISEADLWRWDQSNTSFTDFSAVLPSEGCGGNDDGNNPLHIQGGYDLVVSVKPDNPNFVVIGGTNAYKKEDITDSGSRFERIGGYVSPASYALYANHHPDIHALVFSPFDSNVLFSGTDGGVHRTDLITASPIVWTSLNNNYKTYQYYHVAIDPSFGSDYVIGGTQDNGTKIGGTILGLPDATSQIATLGGDGVAVGIPNYAGCSLSFFAGFQNGRLFRFCAGGGDYTEITPEVTPGSSYPSQFVTYFHMDQDNTNAIYYAAETRLLRTTDGATVASDTWTDIGGTSAAFNHSDELVRFSTTWGTYNPASSYLLIGGDSGHIYRLNDPQAATNISDATDITPLTASTTFPSIVSGLAIHPTNNDIVLATYSNYGINSIYLTTNATNSTPTWTLVERNLSAHSIRSAAIVEVAGQTIYYVGTARGFYSTQDPTSTDWVREAPTQIGLALVRTLSYRPSDNHLLIGTHGNGMFESVITNIPLSTTDTNDISSSLSLFPNPTTNEINLKLPKEFGSNIGYNIKNMLGQTVTNGLLSSNKIDVSNLLSGMYFIEIKTDNKTGTKKFIKK